MSEYQFCEKCQSLFIVRDQPSDLYCDACWNELFNKHRNQLPDQGNTEVEPTFCQLIANIETLTNVIERSNPSGDTADILEVIKNMAAALTLLDEKIRKNELTMWNIATRNE